ncbi:MAG: DUF493 family protein [Flavobacteriia bacterium]|nr:DUF493 family protein [Flavobacteriia bacterium]
MNTNLINLKSQLEQLDWPSLYYYKFIIPNTPETLAKVASLFESDSDLSFQPSSKGNYTSVSVKEIAVNAEQVVEKYEKAIQIKGLIAL